MEGWGGNLLDGDRQVEQAGMDIMSNHAGRTLVQ